MKATYEKDRIVLVIDRVEALQMGMETMRCPYRRERMVGIEKLDEILTHYRLFLAEIGENL